MRSFGSVLLAGLSAITTLAAQEVDVKDIGTRRELFVDDYLIERMEGCDLLLHHPVKREIVMRFDKPWEGNGCGYSTTVFHDGDKYRMYYLARHFDWPSGEKQAHPPFIAYAESEDGIRWTRPGLGLTEFEGSKENNILPESVWPFLDTNPDCKPDAKYKAISCEQAGDWNSGEIQFWKSPDGVHWSRMSEDPLKVGGRLDSHNIAYYDSLRGEYRLFFRSFTQDRYRDIKTATSKDFLDWTKGAFLKYSDDRQTHLYTNAIKAYPRAPHFFIGFPMRYVASNMGVAFRENPWKNYHDFWPNRDARKDRYEANKRVGTARTDTLLITSRDGMNFVRRQEAFLRPGPQNWTYADNCCAWHLVETASDIPGAPNELSLYASEGFWTGKDSLLRRYTLRLDGFVSVHAGGDECEMVTRPLVFGGKALEINYATSAAGWIRIEILDVEGRPIPGFTLREFHKVVGDHVDRVVSWNGGVDLSKLTGTPVRLRFVMQDADLYAMRFRADIPEGRYALEDTTYPEKSKALKPTHPEQATRLVNAILVKLNAEYGRRIPPHKELAAKLHERLDKTLAATAISRDEYRELIRAAGRNASKAYLVVPRVKTSPTIDGKLDDPAWKSAAEIKLLRYGNGGTEGEEPPFPVEARICHNEAGLYLAYACTEPDLDALIAVRSERDGQIWRDDSVELGIQDPSAEDGIHVIINSLGAIFDSRVRFEEDPSWKGNIQAAVGKQPVENRWTVEIALPWRELGVTPDKGRILRGNFLRNNITNSEKVTGKPWHQGRSYSYWLPTPYGFGEPSGHGILILE